MQKGEVETVWKLWDHAGRGGKAVGEERTKTAVSLKGEEKVICSI